MKYKRANALVTFKPCPRCGGTGQIPCDGLEPARDIRRQWAESLHMRPVVCKVYGKNVTLHLPGVAVKEQVGGYYGVSVYLAVTEVPVGSYPSPSIRLDGVSLWDWDEVGGKALWKWFTRYDYRDEVTPLATWPENLLEMKPLLEEGMGHDADKS